MFTGRDLNPAMRSGSGNRWAAMSGELLSCFAVLNAKLETKNDHKSHRVVFKISDRGHELFHTTQNTKGTLLSNSVLCFGL